MVASLDGFIAKNDNSVSWMESADTYDKGVTLTEEAVSEFVKSIDCYIMGSHTYEQALNLGWPYGETPVVVLTNRPLLSNKSNIEFYSGDLVALVNDDLRHHYKNIWLVGGAKVVKEFLRLKLADDLVVAIMPILLGDGTLFFDFIGREIPLHLKDVTAYDDGMVELSYEILGP